MTEMRKRYLLLIRSSNQKRVILIFGVFLLTLSVIARSSFLLCDMLTVNNNSEFGGQEAIPFYVCSEIKTLFLHHFSS